MNKTKYKKRAFTLAEAVIALAIIGIVVAASIPMITIKTNNPKTRERMFSGSANGAGQGIVTDKSVIVSALGGPGGTINSVIANDAGSPGQIENYPTALSYWTNTPGGAAGAKSLLDNSDNNAIIRSDRPLIRVGDFNFAQIKDNIFITTSVIPNLVEAKYPNLQTCFNRTDATHPDNYCARNIFLGGKNYEDEDKQHNIIDYAAFNDINPGAGAADPNDTAFSDNTVIGNDNVNINSLSRGSLIAGFDNNLGGDLAAPDGPVTTTTVVGTANKVTANNQVIIGNGLEPANDVLIGIGSNPSDNTAPLISYRSNDTVRFSKNTIVNGIISASSINELSDKRLKNIKGEYKKGLNEVLKVEPILYSLKSDETNSIQVGVIAQDLQKIFPEAVVTMPNGYLGVDVTPVFFATLNALKELSQKTQYEKERTQRLKAEYLALIGSQPKETFSSKVKKFFKKVKMKFTTK